MLVLDERPMSSLQKCAEPPPSSCRHRSLEKIPSFPSFRLYGPPEDDFPLNILGLTERVTYQSLHPTFGSYVN